MRTLIAIPVYNEQRYVTKVLDEVRRYSHEILVIDDGSTDQTPMLLAQQPVDVVRHAENRGYGRSMIDAFRWASCQMCRYDWLITMDCDEQHEPASLPDFFAAIESNHADVISGSRYRKDQDGNDRPPSDRQAINQRITDMINVQLGMQITDAFCGYKAYRVAALRELNLDESGYAFPLQFWVEAAAAGLRVDEVPIRLIYNDPNRSFGGPLDDADHRLTHYQRAFDAAMARHPELQRTAVETGAVATSVDDSESCCCGESESR